MKDIAELIKAVASLIWPLAVCVFFILFKKDIRSLLGRLRRGKLFGQEIELEEKLADLNDAADAAAAAVPILERQPKENNDLIRQIIDEASRSPKVALMHLSSEIDRQVRQLLAAAGRFVLGTSEDKFRLGMNTLLEEGELPEAIARSMKSFQSMRNRLVHGQNANEDEIIRAVDSGITILRSVQAIPLEKHVVYHPGVEVYEDKNGNRLRNGVRAVILEAISPGGARFSRKVFPTTKTHFEKGRQVAWEWDHPEFSESWYRDPDSGKICYGWKSSLQFTGRHLQDV